MKKLKNDFLFYTFKSKILKVYFDNLRGRMLFFGIFIVIFLLFLIIIMTTLEKFSKSKDSDVFMEIREGETMIIEDLTIQNNGGGHKITDEQGDIPFAEVVLETPRVSRIETRMMHAMPGERLQEITFDNYHIRVHGVEWNGETIKLEVNKIGN